jgi:predicted DsbA family dithiol-disulfide isomerase
MGLVDKLKQEFDLAVEWLAFEIHPDTPQEGMLLSTMFPQLDSQKMFANISRISNSRMSLEASECAKEQGMFDRFHRALFQAYFSQGMDIGNIEVLTQIGHESGLDRDYLAQALETGKYLPRIENMRREATRLGVNAAPTFILEDRDRIVGAQPIDVFKKKLRRY